MATNQDPWPRCIICGARRRMPERKTCMQCWVTAGPASGVLPREIKKRVSRKPPRIAKRDWQRPLNHGDGK